MLYEETKSLSGNTPLIRLKAMEQYFDLKVKVFGKLEGLNLTGSVKDRAAYAMIADAIDNGYISPGGTIIEPTSGNTGIGLAALAPLFGLNTIIVMPESMSLERRKLIQIYGANLILTPAEEGMIGTVKEAKKLEKTIENSIVLGQFDNDSNWKIHYSSTGPEIYRDLKDDIKVFIAGVGTGGTITGVGRYLKEKSPGIKIFAVEPEKSPLISQGISGSHNLQGIGANFLPKILDFKIIDKVCKANEKKTISLVRHLARAEGLFVGISSGAALSVLDDPEITQEKNGCIVVMLPDLGNRYLSTDHLFNIN